MAPAPAAPRRGGFSLSNPGVKEYAIVGGLALGGFLLYRWIKNRNASNAATTSPTSGATAPGTPTGLSTSDLLAWIQDHSSSTTTTTTTGGTPTPTPTAPRTVTLAKPRKLSSLASQYRVPLASLRQLNPQLSSFYGMRQMPAGTKVVVSG